MSKYTSKATELLNRVQSYIDSFEIRKRTDGWSDDHIVSPTILKQYPGILLDIQSLFFCDSAQSPFYNRAMKLNERLDYVKAHFDVDFQYSDFIELKDLLSKYLEYREFLEVND